MAVIKRIVRKDKATGLVVSDVSYLPLQVAAHIPQPRTTGLGDLAARFAKPVAKLIDQITERLLTDEMRTELGKCPACARRHRKLNLFCPNVLTCPFLGRLLKMLPAFARKALLDAAQKHMQPTPVAAPLPPPPP